MNIIPGRVYKHYKGNLYMVEDMVVNSETKEKLVLYRALYGIGMRYVMSYERFAGKLDKEAYPNVKQEYRFELQEIKYEAENTSQDLID